MVRVGVGEGVVPGIGLVVDREGDAVDADRDAAPAQGGRGRQLLEGPQRAELAREAVERGLVDVASLVTHCFPLAEIEDAFMVAQSREGLKVIIEP